MDQLQKSIRIWMASMGLGGLEEGGTVDPDTQAIVNQRIGGRKLGDAMKDDFIPAMEETGKILQTFNETIDMTGIIAPLTGKWAGLRDNTDVAIGAMGSVLGAKLPAGMTSSEAKGLVGAWGKGTFTHTKKLIEHSFQEHKAKLGVTNVWDYLRKAAGFNTKGAARKVYEDGRRIKYTRKDGTYIIKDEQGHIVSYGRN